MSREKIKTFLFFKKNGFESDAVPKVGKHEWNILHSFREKNKRKVKKQVSKHGDTIRPLIQRTEVQTVL